MSDKLFTCPIDRLLSWILAEERQGSIFGIDKNLFFMPAATDPFRMRRYDQLLETPVGVAAGPHTQLSQNIISAWLTGARYIELKTVQTLDKIEVAKPCIDMQDEGYNCEWSQELKLRRSFDQYLDAWILIHVLRRHFGWEFGIGPGVIFNMSVGYDLAGIKNANVQEFLDLMENCQPLLEAKLEQIETIYPATHDLGIASRLSDNVTLSTMHGCPPDEIERIARYLIEERRLHTAVKLNPTLLGPDNLRQILTSNLGFRNITVPDQAFEHDLKYDQALTIIRNLQASAGKAGVEFGLKLTNTLEVLNQKELFPGSEEQAYLSGRALHPLSVNLAAKLQTEFDGALDLSFCAGADCFNIADLVACGLAPVTTCSDLLKPGGYGRLKQYIGQLADRFSKRSAVSVEDFINITAGHPGSTSQAALKNLQAYAKVVLTNDSYQRESPFYPSVKTLKPLPVFDCISAPCTAACATDQGIPEYMYHTAKSDFDRAYATILKTNPLPGITGYVCDHLCQTKCTRINYDRPLLIREIKRFVTEHGQTGNTPIKITSNGKQVAVIGGGPSGLSCAYFLALQGFAVEIFEAKANLGGMVSGAIPRFRLGDDSVQNDLNLITGLGVQIHYSRTIDQDEFQRLQTEYDYVYLGLGAQASRKLNIPGEDHNRVLDPLKFLSAVKNGISLPMGSEVIIIGGGNTAMDAARTSLRLVGEGGTVTIVYRRTIDQMPADWEEVAAAQAEGIAIHELLAPVFIEEQGGKLVLIVRRIRLGAKDSSGRPRPVDIPGSDFALDCDYLIPAVGQSVAVDFLDDADLRVDPRTKATSRPKVYAGGDAVRGAYTIIAAVGDGQRAAAAIGEQVTGTTVNFDTGLAGKASAEVQAQRFATRDYGSITSGFEPHHDRPVKTLLTSEQAWTEAARCLYCDEFCDICVTVCPNRANLAYPVDKIAIDIPIVTQLGGKTAIKAGSRLIVDQPTQIANIADFCNECGNCTTFCPTAGAPWRDKPRICLSEAGFADLVEGYYLRLDRLDFKSPAGSTSLQIIDEQLVWETPQLTVTFDKKTLELTRVDWKTTPDQSISLEPALRMAVIWKGLREISISGLPLINQEH
ncbi:MAG: putative selenate reductase subunit YgfK [Candidatus Neomarinimicrobiota bacterium]